MLMRQTQLVRQVTFICLKPASSFPPGQFRCGTSKEEMCKCVDRIRPNCDQPGTFGLNLIELLAFQHVHSDAVGIVPCRCSRGSVCFISYCSISCNLSHSLISGAMHVIKRNVSMRLGVQVSYNQP